MLKDRSNWKRCWKAGFLQQFSESVQAKANFEIELDLVAGNATVRNRNNGVQHLTILPAFELTREQPALARAGKAGALLVENQHGVDDITAHR